MQLIDCRKLKRKSRVLAILAVFLILFISVLYSLEMFPFNKEELLAVNTDGKSQIIIIDPGHGGVDAGATGVSGVYEKDLNLEIALTLGELLHENGFTVVYTRTTDRMLYREDENIKGMRKLYDLKNRCAVAEGYEDAIFVSIHMNSFGASKYSGLQVYYSDGNEESRALAEKIQTSVRESLQNNNQRQIKNGKNLYILDNCKALTVLVECGFLSNPYECAKLSDKEYQKELCFSVVCGIIDYTEMKMAEK